MTQLFHIMATLIVAPYIALAAVFLAIGRVASTKGLWAAFDAALEIFNWIASWGLAGFVLVIATISILGCFTQTRLAASIALAALAGLSLLVLLLFRSSSVTSGELVTLAPCAVVLLYEVCRIRALLAASQSSD